MDWFSNTSFINESFNYTTNIKKKNKSRNTQNIQTDQTQIKMITINK